MAYEKEDPRLVGKDGGQEAATALQQPFLHNAEKAGKQGEIGHFCQSALKAALAYAARGWRIFPLHSARAGGGCSCGDRACTNPGKHPRTARGQNDATTDAEQIRRWWSAWPDANIGLHCAASGIAVVDIDPRNGGDATFAALEIQHGDITSPLVSHTGGGGRHIFFAAPRDACLPGKLGAGIDLKYNGYVILPPSNHASGGIYQWDAAASVTLPPLPDWITRTYERRDGAASGAVVEMDFNDFCEAVFALPQELCDYYPDWINVGMAIFHQTDGSAAGLYLFDEWSAQSSKYRAGQPARKWRSFERSLGGGPRVTARTILKAARENGWRPWDEVALRLPKWLYRDATGEVALSVAMQAVEQADRAELREHVLMIAMEVAKGNLDEAFARDVLWHECREISAVEFELTWTGAMRFAPTEVAVQQMLADELAGTLVYAEDVEGA